jgi:hypothetical protein
MPRRPLPTSPSLLYQPLLPLRFHPLPCNSSLFSNKRIIPCFHLAFPLHGRLRGIPFWCFISHTYTSPLIPMFISYFKYPLPQLTHFLCYHPFNPASSNNLVKINILP